MIELGHTTDRKPPFRYAAYTRVAFGDTDAQGVVYYGRYLPYFDLARTEYHRHLGTEPVPGFEFVMRACEVEYLAPARFDDLLEVFVRTARLGRTSVGYEYAAYRIDDREGHEDVLLVTSVQTLVLIDPSRRKAVPLPDALRQQISGFDGMEA